eukprot:scaffold15572_cov29-Attheya_sp.AAC.2
MAFRRRASPRHQSLSPSSSVSSPGENHRSGSTTGISGGRGLQSMQCGCFRGVFLWGVLLLVVFSVGLIGNVSYLWHSHLQLNANTKQNTNHYSPISMQRVRQNEPYAQQQQQSRVPERSIEDGRIPTYDIDGVSLMATQRKAHAMASLLKCRSIYDV